MSDPPASRHKNQSLLQSLVKTSTPNSSPWLKISQISALTQFKAQSLSYFQTELNVPRNEKGDRAPQEWVCTSVQQEYNLNTQPQFPKASLCVWRLHNDFMTDCQTYEIDSTQLASALAVRLFVSPDDSPPDLPFTHIIFLNKKTHLVLRSPNCAENRDALGYFFKNTNILLNWVD